MDTGASTANLQEELPEAGAEQRVAPRFTLLIRAAKLVSGQGEFVCVIRDVSETGVSVRMFHAQPGCAEFELHMPGGTAYRVVPVWQRDNEAGFRFAEPVDVAQLINESGDYPKRGIRLGLCFPIIVSTIAGRKHVAARRTDHLPYATGDRSDRADRGPWHRRQYARSPRQGALAARIALWAGVR
jgi:hypothetical protein